MTPYEQMIAMINVMGEAELVELLHDLNHDTRLTLLKAQAKFYNMSID